MEVITMLNTIKFFSRYTDKLLIDYKELEYMQECYSKEIAKILKFLEYLEKFFKAENIYYYYFKPYFTKHLEYNGECLDLTAFLEYATVEMGEFQADIANELKSYC